MDDVEWHTICSVMHNLFEHWQTCHHHVEWLRVVVFQHSIWLSYQLLTHRVGPRRNLEESPHRADPNEWVTHERVNPELGVSMSSLRVPDIGPRLCSVCASMWYESVQTKWKVCVFFFPLFLLFFCVCVCVWNTLLLWIENSALVRLRLI
jgi:hypothetical protein